MAESLKQQFTDWVNKQPREQVYDYGDNENCALCQFLREAGYSDNPRAGGNYWRDGSGPEHPIDRDLMVALIADDFGSLADRLSRTSEQ